MKTSRPEAGSLGAAFLAVRLFGGVEERLLIAGIRIPEDVSITGFDNLRDSAEYPVPLTTCCGDPEQMIHEAIAYLFSTRNSGATLEKMFDPRLIVRKSTAPVVKQ